MISTTDSMARDFARTASPKLPAGLNLGRQLFWQQQQFPQEFNRATILPYPQYWAARLCGVRAWEPTSLGCHTDLWEPQRGDFSSFAKTMRWDARFGRCVSAWTSLGPPVPEIAERTGLSNEWHDPRRNPRQQRVVSRPSRDSRRSFLRRVDGDMDRRDGTRQSARRDGARNSTRWRTSMRSAILSRPRVSWEDVNTPRFAVPTQLTSLIPPSPIWKLSSKLRALPIPSFSDQGGPFRSQVGRIVGNAPQRRRVIQPHSRRSIVR